MHGFSAVKVRAMDSFFVHKESTSMPKEIFSWPTREIIEFKSFHLKVYSKWSSVPKAQDLYKWTDRVASVWRLKASFSWLISVTIVFLPINYIGRYHSSHRSHSGLLQTHIHTYIYTYTYTSLYIYIYIHTHIFTHANPVVVLHKEQSISI